MNRSEVKAWLNQRPQNPPRWLSFSMGVFQGAAASYQRRTLIERIEELEDRLTTLERKNK